MELRLRLLEDEGRDGDWEVFGKARKYYKSCMNLERLEELGVRPMLDTLKELGGWPVIEGDGWSDEGYQWWEQGGNSIEIFRPDFLIEKPLEIPFWFCDM